MVFGWVLKHTREYGLDRKNIFAVGDSAGAHTLGLHAAILSNPEYAGKYAFKTSDKDNDNLSHVFHLDIRSDDAVKCNDDEYEKNIGSQLALYPAPVTVIGKCLSFKNGESI